MKSGAVLFTGPMRRELCSFVASQQFGPSYAVVNAAPEHLNSYIPGASVKNLIVVSLPFLSRQPSWCCGEAKSPLTTHQET